VYLCIYLSIEKLLLGLLLGFNCPYASPPFKHTEKESKGCVSLVVAKGSAFMDSFSVPVDKTWSDSSHCTDLVIFVKYSS
jgi:hypothetical protein